MKKIVITALLILPLLSFIAQEEEGKNFRFGLMGNTSIGWLTPDDERKFSSGGCWFRIRMGASDGVLNLAKLLLLLLVLI